MHSGMISKRVSYPFNTLQQLHVARSSITVSVCSFTLGKSHVTDLMELFTHSVSCYHRRCQQAHQILEMRKKSCRNIGIVITLKLHAHNMSLFTCSLMPLQNIIPENRIWYWDCCQSNRESPPQFENRIKPRVYVRRITRSTMYEKSPFC